MRMRWWRDVPWVRSAQYLRDLKSTRPRVAVEPRDPMKAMG